MKPDALPFNRVILRTEDGTRLLTVSEFDAIPLTQRVRALLEKRFEFFMNQTPVEQQDALRALRERA